MITTAKILVIFGFVLCVGCSSLSKSQVGKTKLAPTPLAVIHGPKHYSASLENMALTPTVPVFIFSTRNLVTDCRSGVNPFGTERLKSNMPHFAIADVSVGANVSPQTLMQETLTPVKRKRTRIAVEEIRINPETEATIENWRQLESRDDRSHPWVSAIRRELDKGVSREIVILVHGYNTHLLSNTELLAEVLHYKGRDGAVINFEWPSEGRLLGYLKDKGNATHSTLYFRALLDRIAQQTDAHSIRVIAHSAGCPIAINALRELRMWNDELTADQLHRKYKIDQVVLAAPDMDSMEFSNAVFDRFYEMAGRVGIYFSPRDDALAFAENVMGGQRLGRAMSELLEQDRETFQGIDQLEVIDVRRTQSLRGDLLGHSYYYRDPWVSSDIAMSMSNFRPANRGLVRSENGLYWELPEDYPERLKYVVSAE